MAGNSPAAAIEAFVGPLRIAVSCVTHETLSISGNRATGDIHILMLAHGGVVVLDRDAGIGVKIRQRFRVIEVADDRDLGPFKTQTAAYDYAVFGDGDEKYRIAYEWHPVGTSAMTKPHLHVRREDGATPAGHVHHKVHLPTGRISIEEFLFLAIEEFGVQPRRENWREVLTDSQSRYEAYRQWATSSGPSS